MPRTLEAVLKATTGGFDSAMDRSASKVEQVGNKAVAAGAKVDSSMSRAGSAAARAGTQIERGGAAAASGLDRSGKASDRFTKSMAGVARSDESLRTVSRTAGIAGAAVAAGLGLAVRETANFDEAVSGVASTSSEAAGRIDELRKAAIDAGARTKYSATEAANAQEELAKANVSVDDTLKGGLQGALDLAAAGTLDVAKAAEIAATAMSQFKLKGEDVPHIADLLAAGAGKAQGSVEDFGEALKYVGPVAEGMGISIEQTVGTLAEFANVGIKGEQGGTALRGVLLSLSAPSKEAAKTMKQYGIELYDAQGRFIGINGAAQELKDGLGKLDAETRDAALGQIFGNAQITAARALYNGGAADVDQWTKAVDDSGYAARVAATKMDNLKGDVEKLGGSLQTALIQSGDGGTAGLRGLVKGADDLIGKFNDLPPSAKSAGLAAAAVGAAGLLSVAGLGKLAISINENRTAMANLRKESPRTAGALTAISRTAGIASAAIIGLQVVGAVASSFSKDFTPSVEKANDALVKLNQGNQGDLDALFKFDSGIAIKDNVDSLGSAFQRLNRSQGLLGFGDFLDQSLDKLTGRTDALTGKIIKQFAGVDQSLTSLAASGKGDQAAASFKKIADAAELQGYPLEKLIELFPQYAGSIRTAAESSKFTITSTQQLADIMSGDLNPAMQNAGTTVDQAGNKITDFSGKVDAVDTALRALSGGGKLTADAINSLNESVFKSGNAFQTAAEAHAAFEASIDDASATIKTNGETLTKSGKALEDNTAKGRENLAAIGQIASAGKGYVQSLIQQGASTEKVTDATKTARDEFISAARAAGLGRTAAAKLADSYGLIPSKVQTKIELLKDAVAKQQVEDLAAALKDLPPETRSKIYAIYDKKGPEAARAALAALDRTTAKPKVAAPGSAAKQLADATKAAFIAAGRQNAKPKITAPSGAAKAAADLATSALRAVGRQNPTPRISVSSNASAVAGEARRVISTVQGKTVTITVQRKYTGRDDGGTYTGGLITPYGPILRGPLHRSNGGPVWGAGTATSDSIDAKLSNGEFVIRAKSVQAIGANRLDYMNRTGEVPKFAGGGGVGAAQLAGGGVVTAQTTDIMRLIAATLNPLSSIATDFAAVVAAQKQLAAATRAAAPYKATYDRAEGSYQAAVNRRDRERLANANQLKAARDRVARAEETKSKKDDKAARENLSRVSRGNTAEMARLNARVTETGKARNAAQEVYNRKLDATKAATERLKDAQQALVEQQKQLAEAAKQTSDQFAGMYRTTSTDARDWIDLMSTGATDITAFTARIQQLRRSGLSETLVQQIIGMGAVAGSELATQIAAGGAGLVAQLNKANGALQTAADNLGYVSASGVKRAAFGGYMSGPGTGTSDSIPAWLSNGEYVVNAKATAANRPLLDQMNYGRDIVQTAHFAGGGYASSSPLIDIAALRQAVHDGMAGVGFTFMLDGKVIDARIQASTRSLGRTVGRSR